MATALEPQSSLTVERTPRFIFGKWTPGKMAAWIFLILMTILFILLLLWMISTSLKEPTDLIVFKWIPSRIAWENNRDAFEWQLLWPRWTLNTLIITMVAVIPGCYSTTGRVVVTGHWTW